MVSSVMLCFREQFKRTCSDAELMIFTSRDISNKGECGTMT